VLPRCTSEAMSLFLAEVALAVAPGAHAVVLLDRAGWHLSHKLVIPANITLVPLPAKAPELNPVENIWQFLRENWLSNRIFISYAVILAHCCAAWSRLIDQPWLIISIGLRSWAHRF
jgi:transposase